MPRLGLRLAPVGPGDDAVRMAERAQTCPGMRDIVPPEAELRRQVANRILDVYAGYGYEVIETPAFEDLDVLMGSDGGDNES